MCDMEGFFLLLELCGSFCALVAAVLTLVSILAPILGVIVVVILAVSLYAIGGLIPTFIVYAILLSLGISIGTLGFLIVWSICTLVIAYMFSG
jgi:hypothetical protein